LQRRRDYSIADVKSYPYDKNGQKITERLIELEQGYRVGARIFFEKELTGFGLLAKHADSDFSWEWYSRQNGNRFRKLQGGTAVNVSVSGMPFMEELVEVKFLDDTILRFKSESAQDDTHRIIIKAGSVFRFR